MFDIHILPLSAAGQEEVRDGQSDFQAFQTAKKVARQRRKDLLLLHLHLQGNPTLSPDKRALLLQRLSEVYYKSAGTTTGALRAVAESLNQFLFERNARLGNPHSHSVAFLTQIVCQQDRLTIAQSGLSQLYRFSAGGVAPLSDPDLAGNGLGSAKLAKVRFLQLPLQSGDTLLVCAAPPPSWNASLFASLAGQDLEGYRHKLAGEMVCPAWVIQFKNGSGKLFFLPSTPTPAPQIAKAAVSGSPTRPKEAVKPTSLLSPLEAEIALPPSTAASSPAERIAQPGAVEEESGTAVSAAGGVLPPERSSPGPSASTSSAGVSAPAAPMQSPSPQQAQPVSSRQTRSERFYDPMRRLAQRLRLRLPDQSLFQIPTSVMAIIALLTPLLVVSLAAVVYFRQGQMAEFERALALAQQAAQQAQSLPDPLQQRAAWQATLAYLDQAAVYANSSQAQALRAQAIAAIDQLESIRRLDYAVAMDDLPKEAQITKIAVTENEVFLLDANQGVVWRATAAARGYVLNAAASCGPGIQGAAVAKLVGFGIARKPTQLQAVIIGVDANGKVVTCDPSQPPLVSALTPDERGMGSISGFLIDRGNSYVLDPQKNAVWIYWKNKYEEKPELFFSEDVPPMENVVDFAVYGEDLYLLYGDGHLAQCTYSATTPTRCVDPQPYKDTRPGREGQIMQSETPFTRLYISQPPEPALYLLEPSQAAIYQFSLRVLAFHSQLRSIPTSADYVIPQGLPATALAVSSEQRLAFLAFGNRLYSANLP